MERDNDISFILYMANFQIFQEMINNWQLSIVFTDIITISK